MEWNEIEEIDRLRPNTIMVDSLWFKSERR